MVKKYLDNFKYHVYLNFLKVSISTFRKMFFAEISRSERSKDCKFVYHRRSFSRHPRTSDPYQRAVPFVGRQMSFFRSKSSGGTHGSWAVPMVSKPAFFVCVNEPFHSASGSSNRWVQSQRAVSMPWSGMRRWFRSGLHRDRMFFMFFALIINCFARANTAENEPCNNGRCWSTARCFHWPSTSGAAH